MDTKISYPIDIFMKYREFNIDIPVELLGLVDRNKRPLKQKREHREGGSAGIWRKIDPRFKNSWITTNKLNQDVDEKLYSSMRGILNKLSADNFDKLIDELMSLSITSKEHLDELATIIFHKAISEQTFSIMYAKLCNKLLPYYIEKEGDSAGASGQKIFYREFLLNKCQEMFESCTSKHDPNDISKERILGCIVFIGELYNANILTNPIIYGCFLTLMVNITKQCVYSLDSLCTLMTIVGKEFCKKDKIKADHCLKKMEQLLESTEISMRERFMIRDVIDKKVKEHWLL
ncbi:MAG: eukaryotic translation initiation factor 4G [Edafosvirus sp.]|uniref:Eukaryotic translation initiation factor 4G n=1 Tax=Edafosvirus sp. TaxID=2487765 RepID=A0A3G4ZV63_9VIRU|nr:MAG: eukaryotic translation initiation factor 4G [Edafosvirus sp.]